VSVNGAEEDGVDNRVEAPTWVPDGGSDSQSPGEESDKAAVPAPEIPADSGEDKLTATQDTSAGTRPKVSKGATAGDGLPADAADGKPAVGSARADFGSPSALGSPSGFGPVSGNGATQPAPVKAPAAPAPGLPQPPRSALPGAVGAAGAASAARGFASRVSTNLSGLTKPKGKPKAKAPVAGKPAAQRMPPMRPQVPVAGRQPGISYGPPAAGQQARRAQLRLDRIEPWSVMKFSFLISIVGWVVLLVVVSVLYFALSKLGVFTSIEHTVGLVTTSKSNPGGSDAASWFKASRVLGYTMLVGAVNVILMTAVATIGAVLYNLVTMLAGGIEVTLKESD
jgi:Transmembrane domain of unknown function (DUF3566)